MTDDDKDDDINLEIGGSIRDMALDQMCAGLRAVGIAEDKIAAARKQAVEQNSDKPMLDLFKQRQFLR